MRLPFLLVPAMLLLPGASSAQTQYFDLEAGRPLRIEDAVAGERFALDVTIPTLRVERMPGDVSRARWEPKLAFGALPFTELEVRLPYLWDLSTPAGAPRTRGLASVAFGAMRALNLETRRVPALALSAEAVLPAGEASAQRTAYSVRLLATKSTPAGRVHLNVAGGTYGTRTIATDSSCDLSTGVGCGAIIPDTPCSISPGQPGVAARCIGAALRQRAAASSPPTSGTRWMGAVGFDHALPLIGTLFAADIVVEHFQGFSSKSDMTLEVGARRQLTTQLVIDAGLSRRFTGQVPMSAVTFGATYTLIVRPTRVRAATPARQP